MISERLHSLYEIPDSVWWDWLFEKDHMCSRVSVAQRAEFIAEAVNAGKESARAVMSKYSHSSLREILDLSKIRIEYEKVPPDEPYVYYAYFEEPDRIVLNSSNLEKFRCYVEENGFEKFCPPVPPESLLLGHEFYHAYEFCSGNSLSDKLKFTSFSFGPVKFRARLSSVSEIAAMVFAKEINGCSCNPCVLNILFQLPYNFDKAVEAIDKLKQKADGFSG